MYNEKYMREAIRQARKAMLKDEVPVGCIIVKDDKIIARAYNYRQTKQSALAHAEMIAIAKANKALGCWHLEGCKMYITLEPCVMCAGAIIQSRITEVYFGAREQKGGCAGSKMNLLKMRFQNPEIYIEGGILENECSNLMIDFFNNLRKK